MIASYLKKVKVDHISDVLAGFPAQDKALIIFIRAIPMGIVIFTPTAHALISLLNSYMFHFLSTFYSLYMF